MPRLTSFGSSRYWSNNALYLCVMFLLITIMKTDKKKKEGTVLFILLLHFLAHSFQLSFHGLDLFQEFGTLILLVELNLS